MNVISFWWPCDLKKMAVSHKKLWGRCQSAMKMSLLIKLSWDNLLCDSIITSPLLVMACCLQRCSLTTCSRHHNLWALWKLPSNLLLMSWPCVQRSWKSLPHNLFQTVRWCVWMLQIRLDAFGLLCEHHKTTEVIPQSDLDLVQFYLPFNMCSQMPGFRQRQGGLLKKVLTQAEENGYKWLCK